MALTNLEKQRRFRERQAKARAEAKLALRGKALKDATSSFLRRPFFEHFAESQYTPLDLELHFDLMGITGPAFTDDTGPRASDPSTPQMVADAGGKLFDDVADNSLGKAEVIYGQLIDAARHLANAINEYKRSELQARIAELESDASLDPAFKAVVRDRLNDLLARFQKETRESFPVTRIDGE